MASPSGRVLQRLLGRDDHLGGAGGERLAGFRGAGLHHDRMPLRRTRHVEGAAHRNMRPLVREEVQLFGIEEAPGFAVAHEGVVRVGIPQAAHDIDELLRPGGSVTRFQPARPPLRWSRKANLRATWNGSL